MGPASREGVVADPGACWCPRGAILGPDTHSSPFALELFVSLVLFILLDFLPFIHKESVHWKSQLKQGEIKREASGRDSHHTRI